MHSASVELPSHQKFTYRVFRNHSNSYLKLCVIIGRVQVGVLSLKNYHIAYFTLRVRHSASPMDYIAPDEVCTQRKVIKHLGGCFCANKNVFATRLAILTT